MTTTMADEAATSEGALPTTRGLRLLGTMGTGAAPTALLLLGNDVLTVAPGDNAGTATVIAIEPGRVIVQVDGETRSLRISG